MNSNEYSMPPLELEQVAKAYADKAVELTPESKTFKAVLTVEVREDRTVTVYSPRTDGNLVPVYDSEVDLWASYR